MRSKRCTVQNQGITLKGKISPPPQPIFSKTLKSHVWKQTDHNSAHPKLSSDTKETMSHKAVLQNCVLPHFSQNGSWTRNHLSKMLLSNCKSKHFVRFQKRIKLYSINVFGSFLACSSFLYISSLTYNLLLHGIVASWLSGIGGNQTEKSNRQIAKLAVDFCHIFVQNSHKISQDFHHKVAVFQSGECLSAEQEVTGSNPGRTNTQGL